MSTEVRFPSGRIEISGGGVDHYVSEGVQMTLAIGELPRAATILHQKRHASEGALSYNNPQISRFIGTVQGNIFKERLTPDALVVIDDGNGHNLTMRGYQADPGFSYGRGVAGMSLTVVHESAVLSTFNPQIYGLLTRDYRFEDEDVASDVLSTRILKIQQSMLKQWQNRRKGDDERPQDTIIYDGIHAVNQKLMPIWERVLEHTGTLLDWEQIKRFEEHIVPFNDNIVEMLMRPSPDFFSTMMSLANAFQAVWVPDIRVGYVGRLIRRKLLFENPIDLRVQPIHIQYSAGAKRLLPISHAVVRMIGAAGHRASTKGDGPTPVGVTGVWPETPYAGGGVINDPGPTWAYMGLPKTDKEIPADGGDGRLDLGVLQRRLVDFHEKRASTVELLDDICSDWAKDLYVWNALGSSTAYLKIPLNVTLKPGFTHNVRSADGTFLFRGLLQRVVHDVAGGQSPAASTSLVYSHIEAGRFSLPNGYS
jgi:hypothetical protein